MVTDVRVKNATGWSSIYAGAVPDSVRVKSGSEFKSIVGLDDPPGPQKLIRNQAGDDWYPLDIIPVLPPPVVIGTTTRTSNSNKCRFYRHADAQAGDLILGFGGQRTASSVTFSSDTAQLLWNYKNGNLLAQAFVGAAIHDGVSQYYQISSSNFNQCSSIAITIRGAAPISSLTVGNQTYSPSSQIKNILDQTVTENSLSIAGIIEEYINGSPYTYNSGPWQILEDYAVGSSSGNDVMVASYIPTADGQSGTGQFTGLSSSNAGYTSQVIGVPPA